MNVSQGVVHPVEAPPPLQTEGAGNVLLPRVRMKDFQGMPGTLGGVFLRFSQLLFAVVALSIMATTTDFASVTAFWSLLPLLSQPPVHLQASPFSLATISVLVLMIIAHGTRLL